MLRRVMLCCVLLCAQAAFALDFGRMRADEVAVYVQDMQSGQVLVSHREARHHVCRFAHAGR